MINFRIETTMAEADLLVLPFVKEKTNQQIWKRANTLTGLDVAEEFHADKDETIQVVLPKRTTKKVALLGLGESPSETQVANTFRLFAKKQTKNIKRLVVDLRFQEELIGDAAAGMSLSSYDLGQWKEEKKQQKDLLVVFCVRSNQLEKAEKLMHRGNILAASQKNIMRLVDAPSNYKTPEIIASYIADSGKKNGFDVKIWDEKDCLNEGFHALLAVGKGSTDAPVRMVLMEYKPEGFSTPKKIGFVGKGVTFDTGGVSLKPGDGMEHMKSDMGGCAAVIGAMETISSLKLPVHVFGMVALTENCVDGTAIKPGDVINSYSGKTIEVINTDAEGRLILADALHYMAKNIQPEVMVDLATLTGSCIRSLGYVAAGLMTQNDKLAMQLYDLGLRTGEKLWRLPLWDVYASEMDSEVADIKNLSAKPLAGATTAGKFLEFFTDKHACWAHLDIAGTAFGANPFSKSYAASGYGVRLLTALAEEESL